MPNPILRTRCARTVKVVSEYERLAALPMTPCHPQDIQAVNGKAVIDLMVDLLHLTALRGDNPAALLNEVAMHFEAETRMLTSRSEGCVMYDQHGACGTLEPKEEPHGH